MQSPPAGLTAWRRDKCGQAHAPEEQQAPRKSARCSKAPTQQHGSRSGLAARARDLQAGAQRDQARPLADRDKVLQRQRGAHGQHARGQPRRHGILAQAGEERGARERGRRRRYQPEREQICSRQGRSAQAPLDRTGAASALCRAARGQAAGPAPRGAPRPPEPHAGRRCRAAGGQDAGLPARCTPHG